MALERRAVLALLLLACAAAPLAAACGDPGSGAASSDGTPATGDPDGTPGDGGPGTLPDGAPADATTDPRGAPATPAGKLDPLCMFTSNPFQRDDLLLVEPSGKRIAYPRLVPPDAGEIVIRDLETNKVTKLASLGTCHSVKWAGSEVLSWSANTPVSWMRSTPYGILIADEGSAIHLVDWSGAEKARLPGVGHAWASGEVSAVSATPSGIRAAMVGRTGAAARLVTFASDGGAGIKVESADLTPAFAAGANVETAVSADGSHVAVIVDFKTLYAAPTTAGAAANVLYLQNAGFTKERTAHGALMSDLFNSSDVKPSIDHVDFATAEKQVLEHFPAKVVATSQVGTATYLSEIDSSASAVTTLATWRFEPGALPVSVASTAPSEGNPLPYGTYAARTTADGSSYVFSLDGVGSRQGLDLVYSVSLKPGASTYRPVRVAYRWGVGGTVLATVEQTGTNLRFEDLASSSAPIEVPVPAALQQRTRLQGVSKNGHLGFFEIATFDAGAKNDRYTVASLSDAGVRRDDGGGQRGAALDVQAAWTDGVITVRDEGFFFFR